MKRESLLKLLEAAFWKRMDAYAIDYLLYGPDNAKIIKGWTGGKPLGGYNGR